MDTLLNPLPSTFSFFPFHSPILPSKQLGHKCGKTEKRRDKSVRERESSRSKQQSYMERERERRLSEATLNGSVDTLNALIKEDPVILDRVSTTWFDETPLHIAVLRGHLDFCKALLSEKPKFSTEVDLQGRLPLHLASVEGYVEIVRELLHVKPDTCLDRDRDENIPLHLAVMKGRIEVIKELIQARPNSIMEKLDNGETVLHLAVKHNHLEALKLLVEAGATETGFVSSIDENGNTALHVAAMHKRKEMVKYLLSRSEVETNKNAVNNNGLTVLDVLEHCPRDVKGMKILNFLHEAEVRRGANKIITITTTTTTTTPPPPPPQEEEEVADHQHNEIVGPKKMSKIGKLMKYLRTSRGEKWYEKTQQTLMLVATVLANMSFQAAMNPPGGVWQEDIVTSKIPESETCTHLNPCYVGTSVLAYAYPYDYKEFLFFNTSSFIASLSIILLIISGFPLKNKICMWLLILTMCTAVVFMALAYLRGMIMVADGPLLDNYFEAYEVALYTWFGIIGAVGLIFLTRFLYWLVRKLRKFTLKM